MCNNLNESSQTEISEILQSDEIYSNAITGNVANYADL
jgi:ribosome maturation protein SDO1